MKNGEQVKGFAIIPRTLLTGFIGGVFWTLIGLLMYYFNFVEVNPKSFIMGSWITQDWTNGWIGYSISVFVIGILSMLTALIYFLLFKQINSIWIGFMYGIILWVIFVILIQPMYANVPQLVNLKKETIVTSISLFILYGTFIGYSISYDYYDTYVLHKK